MESLKEKLPAIIGVVIVILLLGIVYYMFVIKTDTYYTQIDNTKIEKVDATDEMKYQYKLTAYDENGKEKEVTFKTSRELKDKAYLELTYMETRGVTNWKEVQYNELPSKVQSKYKVE